MGLIFTNTLLEIGLGFLVLLWSFYRYLTKDYDFWARHGVPHRKPVFPFGSLRDLILGHQQIGDAYADVYREFPNERYCGVLELHRPVLVIRDPELIRAIMVRDFNHFVDRAPFEINTREKISKHLFLLDGEEWRFMRQKLSPAFTSGKMKMMFVLMRQCSEQLADCLERVCGDHQDVDMKEVLAKFTMDVIATCAFGLEINSMKDESNEFHDLGVAIFKPTTALIIKHRIIALFPRLGELLNLERVASKPKRLLHEMVSSTVQFREKNNVVRNDFIDLLIKIRQNKSLQDDADEPVDSATKSLLKEGEEELTMDQVTAQAFIFFAAGFETASSTMTFCLYELAKNQEVQERLSKEVNSVLKRHAGLTYAALQDMKYMDQVINETLRMYASLAVLHRRCTETYRVPDSDLVLQRGQKIVIPTFAIHHDPQHYPDPERFDPERFSPDNVRERHPYLHLPFGTGPRNCIGMRFGLMQTKVGLATVLGRSRVQPSSHTSAPIQLLPTSFVTQPDKPVFLTLTKRQ